MANAAKKDQFAAWNNQPIDDNSEPTLSTGQYTVEVMKAKSNINGDPFITFRINDTPNKYLNAWMNQNFNMSVGSDKSRAWASRKWAEFVKATGIELGSITGPDDFIAREVILDVTQAGEWGSLDIKYTFRPLLKVVANVDEEPPF